MTSYEETRVAVLTEASNRDHAELEGAAEKLEAARRTFGAKRARLEEASAAYATHQTTENENAVRSARDDCYVAEIPMIAATRAVDRRQEAVRISDAALADARATLDARKSADEIADLHRLASIEHLAALLAPLAPSANRLYRELGDVIQAMDGGLAASNAASAELRRRGEISADLGPHHLLVGFIEKAVKEHPELAGTFLELLDPRRAVGGAIVHQLSRGLAPLIRIPLLEQLAGGKASPQPAPLDAPEKLRAFLTARTLTEATAASDAIGSPAKPLGLPAPSGPPARYSIGAPPPASSWADEGAGR